MMLEAVAGVFGWGETAVGQAHFSFHPKTLVFGPQNTSVFLKKTSDFCNNTCVFSQPLLKFEIICTVSS